MNKQFHKDYKRFLKEIKKELTCSPNLKLAFIHDFKEQIKDVINEQDITINDVITNFGNPKEIASSFESHNDLQRLNKIAKKYKYLKLLVLILSVIVVIALVFIIYFLIFQNDFTNIINY